MTMVVLECPMKKMAAGVFKAHCLAVMDEVQSRREAVVITKRGKPVAKLVPAEPEADDIYGFMVGKVKIKGDLVAPALSRKEWGKLA
jgi:prevent-host-death family protein